MPKAKLTKDIEGLIQSVPRITGYRDDSDPYIIRISGKDLLDKDTNMDYDICSGCREYINQAWNHAEWCKMYKPEPLMKWIQDGEREQK